MDTFGTGRNCPSYRGVRLIEIRGNMSPVPYIIINYCQLDYMAHKYSFVVDNLTK